MSTTIDQRVVEMQFDNRQFESNVRTTMSTLDRLKQSLNLTGASKGLENINSEARHNNLSALSSAAETVGLRFSAMYTIADQALRNITNSVQRTATNMAKALTIDPIKTGFSEYETQINAVQTILANTKSKGTDIKDVNKALDTLNTYADKTIYNFTEMTRNIGTFTAAGVDLDTSVKSIQGIANLAAVSGSNSQQASTAMYQLSQALAAGKVSLMDWNSVVNAGMGGEVFQNALKRTAASMGTDVDAIIKKYGSFRESLTQGEWLTTEVLTKTLEQFTMCAEKGTKEWEAYKKSLMDDGYTEKQAEEILDMANTATDAATKVKTFTQLWDTLKEAAQSGWTQTWEIIVGDFEEAKELLTNISDVIGAIIGKTADSRNKILQSWKDLGGRQDLIDGFSNIFDAITNIAKPVKEAFDLIFGSTDDEKVTKLVSFTQTFKEVTAAFANFIESHADEIRSTFEGIFSVIDVGVEIVKSIIVGIATLIGKFGGVETIVLKVTSAVGDWLTNFRNSIVETDIFGTAIEKVVGFIGGAIDKLKEFGKSVKDNFKFSMFNGLAEFTKKISEFISKAGTGIVKLMSQAGDVISNIFGNVDIGNVADIINTGLFASILLGIKKFVGGLTESLDEAKGILENVSGVLDDVRGCFEAYQNQLKAGTLIKIAAAIGILTASIFVLSTIDRDSLGNAVGALTVLFGELIGSLSLFSKVSSNITGVMKAVPLMIGMSIAIVILSTALKKISKIDPESITKGLVTIGVLMAELAIFLNTAKFDGKVARAAVGMVLISSAMLILAQAVKNFGSMDWSELGKGLAAIGGLLAELAIFTRLTGNAQHVVSTGVSMVLLGAAMKILASAVKDFGSMDWSEIAKGLVAMGGALAELTIATNLMPKNIVSTGVGLVIVGSAMKILASALNDFGGMTWDEIGRGLTVMGGALAILSIGLMAMNGSLAGSAALVIAAGALALIAPVISTLGNMSWAEIGKGLLVLAGAFGVIGVAGLLLGPIIPSLLGLSAAVALFGAGCLAVGVGVTAFAAGLSALAISGTAGVAALTAIVISLINLIPLAVQKIAEGIVAMVKSIADSASVIAESVMKLIFTLLDTIAQYIPKFAEVSSKIVVGLLEGITKHLPAIIQAAFDLAVSFINGFADAIENKGPILMDAMTNLISSLVSLVVSIFKKSIPDLISVGADLISGLVEGIGSMLGAVVEGIVDIGKALVNGIKKFLGIHSPSTVFKTIGVNIIQGLCNGIKSMISKAGNLIKTIATNCVNAIKSKLSTFRSTGKDLITNLIQGFKSKVTSAVNAIKDIPSKCLSALKEKISSFKTAGKNVIEGFISGIKSKLTAAANAASNLGKSALKSIKNTLGIKSPSKEFFSVGRFSIEGFVNALSKFSSRVESSASDLGNNALNSFRDSLSKITEISGNDITDQPTIRPVVDLSSVKAGAKSIRGMLDIGSTVGVTANVGAISTMMNGRNQNGPMDDVVSAINKLRGELGNVGGNSYNINGITYDDGSNVSDAVRTLVRAARMERRV